MATNQGSDPDHPSPAELRLSTDSHTLIKGRRWRRSDPALDETIRQHLVDELMDARRGVKGALRVDDTDVLAAARRRVNDAKVALGERGPRWWTDMSDDEVVERAEATVRALNDRIGSHLTVDEAVAMLELRR